MGRTIPYNLYGQACASFNTGGLTGNCTNSGDTRAASASIYLNSYYYFELSTYQYTLQLHEAGHVFGMGHSYCDDDSIMANIGCLQLWSNLRQMDKNWINANY